MNHQNHSPSLMMMLLGLTAVTGVALANHTGQPNEADDWQHQQIHHPGKAQLQRERQGRVTIYDGFTDREVDSILDRHFRRMDYMMFTRIKLTDQRGRVLKDRVTEKDITEDDGCDE